MQEHKPSHRSLRLPGRANPAEISVSLTEAQNHVRVVLRFQFAERMRRQNHHGRARIRRWTPLRARDCNPCRLDTIITFRSRPNPSMCASRFIAQTLRH